MANLTCEASIRYRIRAARRTNLKSVLAYRYSPLTLKKTRPLPCRALQPWATQDVAERMAIREGFKAGYLSSRFHFQVLNVIIRRNIVTIVRDIPSHCTKRLCQNLQMLRSNSTSSAC